MIKKLLMHISTLFKITLWNLEIIENPYIINQVLNEILDPVEKFIS